MHEGSSGPDPFTGPLLAALISLMAGFTRFVFSAQPHSLLGLFRGLLIAVFVGWNVYHFAIYSAIPPDLRIVLVSAAAFIADFMLMGIIKVAEEFSKDPVKWLRGWVLRKKD